MFLRSGGGSMFLRLGHRLDLRFNPGIGLSQAFHKRQAWLPCQFLLDQVVIGIPSPHPLRPGHVIDGLFFPRNFHDHLGELVDGHHFLGANIDRPRPVGPR